MSKILIADDSVSICESLRDPLTNEGHEVILAHNDTDCRKLVATTHPDLILIDIFFGPDNPVGVTLVSDFSTQYPTTPCISMSGESDVYKILDCLKNGAVDFIEKPISLPRLLTSVKNALKLERYRQFSQTKCHILGDTKCIRDLLFKIKKVAPLNETVLIRGESGTGKELVAENIHLYSNRSDQPFYRLNCAALNPELIESELFGHKKGSFTGADSDKKGFFEMASGGSLFLDEIGDLPSAVQSKILRVLQEGRITPVGESSEKAIDTRIICATHQPLEAMITNGDFREDLFYRISTFTVTIPPLRDRLDDVDQLASSFLQQFLDQNNLGFKEFSESALKKLKTYSYPGNVRELSMIVKNAALFTDGHVIDDISISFHDLSESDDLLSKTLSMNLSEAKHFLEKAFLEYRLRQCGDNVETLASELGLIKTNLYRKFRELGIDRK